MKLNKIIVISVIVIIIVVIIFMLSAGVFNPDKELVYFSEISEKYESSQSRNGFYRAPPIEYVHKGSLSVHNDGTVYRKNDKRLGKLNLIDLIILKIKIAKLKIYIQINDIQEKDNGAGGEIIIIEGKMYENTSFKFSEKIYKLYEEILEYTWKW